MIIHGSSCSSLPTPVVPASVSLEPAACCNGRPLLPWTPLLWPQGSLRASLARPGVAGWRGSSPSLRLPWLCPSCVWKYGFLAGKGQILQVPCWKWPCVTWGLELPLPVRAMWGALGLLCWEMAVGDRNETGLGRNAHEPAPGFGAKWRSMWLKFGNNTIKKERKEKKSVLALLIYEW